MTLSVVVVFLGLGAGLIRLLLRLDRSSRDALDAATTLTTLARDLRLDAHRANPDATPHPDGVSLILTVPGPEVVTWTVRPHDVIRERRDGDRLLGRNLYRLGPRATARFERRTGEGHPLLSLVVQSAPTSLKSPAMTSPSPTRIVVELGRWAIPAPGRRP